MIDLNAMRSSVQAAIEATSKGDWKDDGPESGFTFVVAMSQGWEVRVGWAAGYPLQEGSAKKDGVVCHLSPEQSKFVRGKVGECCARGVFGEHNILFCTRGQREALEA